MLPSLSLSVQNDKPPIESLTAWPQGPDRSNYSVREGGWMAQHMLLHVEDIGPVSTPILHINTPHTETQFWFVPTHTICWLTGGHAATLYFSTHTSASQHTATVPAHFRRCATTSNA